MAAQFSASLALGRSLSGSKNSLKAALNVSGESQPPEEYHKEQQGLGTVNLVGEMAKSDV